MASESKTTRGLGLTCPFCREENALMLDADNIPYFHCGECNEWFTPDAVAASLEAEAERWRRVARWCDAAPVRDTEE